MIDTGGPGAGLGPDFRVVESKHMVFVSNVIGAMRDGRVVAHWDDLPPEGQSFRTGKRHLDFREGRLGAQTWLVLHRLKDVLEAHGSGLDGICKMQIYLTNKKLFPFMERVRMRLFESQPPSSCLEVEQVDATGEAMIAIDVVAAVRGSAQRIGSASGRQAIGIFQPGVQTDQHLFLAGMIPIDLETGRVVLDRDDGASTEIHARAFDVDHWSRRIRAQTVESYRQVEALLGTAGLGFSDVVRLVVYLRDMRDYPAFLEVHDRLFTGMGPPLTVFQVTDVGSISEILIEIDAVAALRGTPTERIVAGDAMRLSASPFGATSGDVVFTAARVAADPATGRVRVSPEQLGALPSPAVRRWLEAGPELGRAACQTAAIFDDIDTVLKASALGLSALKKLNILLTDYRDAPAVRDVVAERFSGELPAISMIQVPVVGPGLGATVAIDGVGVSNWRPTG